MSLTRLTKCTLSRNGVSQHPKMAIMRISDNYFGKVWDWENDWEPAVTVTSSWGLAAFNWPSRMSPKEKPPTSKHCVSWIYRIHRLYYLLPILHTIYIHNIYIYIKCIYIHIKYIYIYIRIYTVYTMCIIMYYYSKSRSTKWCHSFDSHDHLPAHAWQLPQ